MRLGELYEICRKHINTLYEFNRENEMLPMSILYSVVDNIEDVKFFSDTVSHINKHRGLGDYLTSNEARKALIDESKTLERNMNIIIDVCESLNLHTDEIGLDIKLPAINDLTDFKNYIDDLEFIFTKCPFLQNNDEKLKFKSVDIGSTWIILAVAGASVTIGSILLNNVAAFIDKCYVIRSHQLNTLRQEEEIKKNKLDQKEKDSLIQSIKKVYDITVDNAIRELEESTGCKVADGDEWGRVEVAIEKMNQLIDKGLQIYSSINAPDEIKALFEPLEMHYLSVENELKRIEEKEDK